DSVALDVLLAREAELGLDRQLHGETMAVPAALALHVEAAHRLVAREDVLEHPAQHVVGARWPVRGGRPFVEAPLRGAPAASQRLGEHVALAPPLEHALLHLDKRGVRIDAPVRRGRPGRVTPGSTQAPRAI